MIDTTEAVRLAAEALESRARSYGLNATETEAVAEAVVTAALPALAEQFAALIEDGCLAAGHEGFGDDAVYCDGCDAAARLVREAAEVTG